MKSKINHDTSEDVRVIGKLFTTFGVIIIIAGIIWALAGGNNYGGGGALPGVFLAISGIPLAFFGSFIKGASLVVRASETYLHLNNDVRLDGAKTKPVSEIISSWSATGGITDNGSNSGIDAAERNIKNDPEATEYRPKKY